MDFVRSLPSSLKDSLPSLRFIHVRRLSTQVIRLGLIVASVLMIWKGLIFLTGSVSPVVVVLTGSMEPGFCKGDILFLRMGTAPIRAGEIVVFHIEGQDIPIVHRCITVHQAKENGEMDILTKGDNNLVDDRSFLYSQGQMWVNQQDIMGRVVGYLPFIGWSTLIMTEKPIIKYLVTGALGLLIITSQD